MSDHEKAFLVCENKCLVEGIPKKDFDGMKKFKVLTINVNKTNWSAGDLYSTWKTITDSYNVHAGVILSVYLEYEEYEAREGIWILTQTMPRGESLSVNASTLVLREVDFKSTDFGEIIIYYAIKAHSSQIDSGRIRNVKIKAVVADL